MPSAAAFTIAYGPEAAASARRLRETFKVVHPDIPFFVIDEAFWPFFARQPKAAHIGEIAALRTLAGYFLSLCFDRVVYLDSDILILSPLPRLFTQGEGEEPVLLTRDKSGFNYALPALPLVNAGVIASSLPDFWILWAMTIYSHATILAGNFFDQFSLRLLAHQKAFPYTLIPPEGGRDHYNISYLDVPGEWRREGEDIFKGEGRGPEAERVRLWHWAGYERKPSPIHLPDPVRTVAVARFEQSLALKLPTYPEENQDLRRAIAEHGAAFHARIEEEFRALSFECIDGIAFANKAPPPGIYACDASAGWEQFRTIPAGLYRRRLPTAQRYLYARSEARLYEADVDALDVPFG